MKKYKSLFGAINEITGSQYIAELIIQRQSKFLKVKLPNNFWKDFQYQDWKAKLLNQKRKVDSLIKAGYNIDIILSALNSSQGKYICSLFNKKLDFLLIEAEREAINLQKSKEVNLSKIPVPTDISTEIKTPTLNKPKTLLDKLKD